MYSPPPPRRRPTCWDPPAYRETPGQRPFHEVSAYEQPPRTPNSRRDQPQAHNHQPPFAGRQTSTSNHHPTCWDQHQDRFQQPRPPSCWDPPELQHTQPAYQQPYHGLPRQPTCWDPPAQHQTASSWCPPRRHRPATCPLEFNDQVFDFATIGGDGRSESMDYPEEYWDFDEYWDAADSQRLSRPYLRHDPSSSSIPAAAAVPPPPPQRSPSCWSPTKHHSQAVSCLEQPTTVQQSLPQRSPSCWNPPSRHCSPTAPLPAAAGPPQADDSQRPSRLHLPCSMEKEWGRELQEGDGEERLCLNMRHINEKEEKLIEHNGILKQKESDFEVEQKRIELLNLNLENREEEKDIDAKFKGVKETDKALKLEEKNLTSLRREGLVYALTNEEVKKVVASLNVVQVPSKNVVGNCWGKKGDGAYTGLPVIACVYVDLNVGDVTSMNHRSTSLDTDARLIPPRNDTPCLSILGGVDKLFVLAWNFADHIGSPLLIFDGGRRSAIRCAFDPGGDASPKLLLSTLFVASWFPP